MQGGTYEEKYIKSIVSICDKPTRTAIPLETIRLEKIAVKYSNTKEAIYKLVIGNKAISRNNCFLVGYSCLTCGVRHEITLNLFMRKVNKNIQACDTCKNKSESKRTQQSQFMKVNMPSIIAGVYEKKVKENTLEAHLVESAADWKSEDDDFQNAYFLTHLTCEEFDRIRPKIVGIGNEKLTSLTEWEYQPCYRIFNQTRYTPMLIHKESRQVEKPSYISFLCDNCESRFTHRDLEIVKNKLKLLCKDCSLCNRTFRLRQLRLKNGETILWQSVYERRFIEWCEEKNIPIKNGPKIPFTFQDTERIYRVDFELPLHKKIVELKDNHCWHKEQVASGRFAAKEGCARSWAHDKGYTFHVVFPKTLSEFKETL
jgi:hypothetical protein